MQTENHTTARWHKLSQALREEPALPAPGPFLRAGAAMLAHLYGLGARGRRSLYDRGWLQPARLPCPVLSIGNLVAGGTGKTPFTAFLAERLQAAGCRVAVLSRGYGGQATGVNVVSDGRRLVLQPPQAGDEAALLALKLPGIPVVTGADRFQAGMLAWERFRPDLFMLDDGFQHFQLHRDLDVVLLDAARPFGNGRLLPRGPLREPVSTLQRPLVLVLTRYEPDRHQGSWEAARAAFPATPVLRAVFSLSHAVHYPSGRRLSLEQLAGLRLAALAGLARPEVFRDSLEKLGIDVPHFFEFPDHHPFSAREVAAVIARAGALGAGGLVTTAKDWLRLSRLWKAAIPLYVVHLQVSLVDPWPLHLMPPGCAQNLRTI